MSFDSLGLNPEILRAIAEQGYVEPTPIQQQAIPVVQAQLLCHARVVARGQARRYARRCGLFRSVAGQALPLVWRDLLAIQLSGTAVGTQ